MQLSTRETLMAEAEKLIRTRGYAAFSYADLSKLVGIRKSSIHHHFPSKEALGAAIIDTYLIKFEDALQNLLDTASTARERLTRYMDFFAASMNSGLLPLCGALAAEKSALPSRLQDRVRYFFELHLKWLSGVVSAGIRTNELRSDLEVDASSRLILSTIEGASLVAWATGDTSVVQSTKNQVLRDIQLQGSSCPI